MQFQIVIDLRLLNARHHSRMHAASVSDYVTKLIPVARQDRVRVAPTPASASSVWDEWLAVPEDRPSRRLGFDA